MFAVDPTRVSRTYLPSAIPDTNRSREIPGEIPPSPPSSQTTVDTTRPYSLPCVRPAPYALKHVGELSLATVLQVIMERAIRIQDNLYEALALRYMLR